MDSYDDIVLGLGGMGSAAAFHLAARGRKVLGLEQFERLHTRGSSHGRTRIIREAYFEAPEYVPLVQRAYALWRELEAESGRPLLTITGGLGLGRPDGELISGMLASARRHRLPYEQLDAAEVRARFPGFAPPDELVAVFEPNAGILQPEACGEAHLDLAAARGAELHFDEPVRAWGEDGRGVRVETDFDVYRAARLVLTAGPWAAELLASLNLPLAVQRMVNAHFEPTRPELFEPQRCPVFIWSVAEGDYFGFPHLPGQGVKFGRHDLGEPCTPRDIRREVERQEVEALRSVLDRYMPGAAGAARSTLTCMYTNTPDRHFVLDRHPQYEQVIFGCGFSGHGFKFASVIGEILADLAIDGETRHPIGFLSAARFRAASAT